MHYVIYSKGLVSTWILDYPHRLLYDCGEGCATALGASVYAVEAVCLSHSHVDHLAGLPTFINLRNLGKGANEKPLTVFYPASNARVREWLGFILKHQHLKYEVACRPLAAGELMQIQGGRNPKFLEGFPVPHGREPSFGYRVLEERQRLKAPYSEWPPEKIAGLMRGLPAAERANYMETYRKPIVAYTGDAMPLAPGPGCPFWEAETLFHDATFLNPADREQLAHATLEEAVQSALDNRVGKLYGIHVSNRYFAREIREAEARGRERLPALSLVDSARVVEIEE